MRKQTIANLTITRPTKQRAEVEAAARAFAGARLVRLSIDVPAELRKGLKGLSVARERSVRDLVIEALQAQYPEIEVARERGNEGTRVSPNGATVRDGA